MTVYLQGALPPAPLALPPGYLWTKEGRES